MTQAFSLGLRYGVQKTLWMMVGELVGVGLVALTTLIGLTKVLMDYPAYFDVLKIIGGIYLTYVAFQMWQNKSNFHANKSSSERSADNRQLIIQGFVTAVTNPKSWAFTLSLLPGFIDAEQDVVIQIITMLIIILSSEFVFMLIYASGGKALGRFLNSDNHLRLLNRFVAIIILIIAISLITGIN